MADSTSSLKHGRHLPPLYLMLVNSSSHAIPYRMPSTSKKVANQRMAATSACLMFKNKKNWFLKHIRHYHYHYQMASSNEALVGAVPPTSSQLRLQRQTRTHAKITMAATSPPLISLASQCTGISGQPISTCYVLTS
jgi:hypothetical protein